MPLALTGLHVHPPQVIKDNKKSDIRAKGLSALDKKHRSFCPAHYSSLL